MGLASDASMQDPSSSSGVSMYHSSDTSSPGYPLGYSPWYWAMPVSPTAFPVAGPFGEHLPGQKQHCMPLSRMPVCVNQAFKVTLRCIMSDMVAAAQLNL